MWRLTSGRTVVHVIKSRKSQSMPLLWFIFFTGVNPRKTQTIARTGNCYFCAFSDTCTEVTVTVHIICEGDFFFLFSIMMKTQLLDLKEKYPYQGYITKPYPNYNQNGQKSAKIDTLIMTKRAGKPYSLRPHISIYIMTKSMCAL